MLNGGMVMVDVCIEGGFVVVMVSDDGFGIEVDVFSCIFEFFFMIKVGGIGFGFVVSIGIVEVYGGMLIVYFEVGCGV